MPAIQPDKVEYYAQPFWHRNLYEEKLMEYQRMAVLHTLNDINSPLLTEYLQAAKLDGRKYLVQYAKKN